MAFSGETASTVESEQTPKRMAGEFFRHDEKSKGKPDEIVTLTPAGRKHTIGIGRNLADQVASSENNVVAGGSQIARSNETSLLMMMAAMHPEWSDEQIEGKVESMRRNPEAENGEIGVKQELIDAQGKPVWTFDEASGPHIETPFLGFAIDESKPLGKRAYELFGQGKFIEFLLQESDNLAVDPNKGGDPRGESMSIYAARIAGMLLRYAQGQYGAETRPETFRLHGTHSGILESFLLKVIQRKEGSSQAETFLNQLRQQNEGKSDTFRFGEGFHWEITGPANNPTVQITYQEKTWNLSTDDLKEIFQQGAKLADQIVANNGGTQEDREQLLWK